MDMDGFMLKMIKSRLDSQVVHDGDFYKDGLLYCGVCGKPRQVKKVLPSGVEYIGVSMCECELNAEMRRREEIEESERRARLDEIRTRSLIGGSYLNARFENCIHTSENEKNIKICEKYADNFWQMSEKNQGLLMWGDVGTGKSYLAACIANRLMDDGIQVVMTSFTQFLGIISKDYSEEYALIDRLMNARLLIIDDLGAERSTDYALEKVYNVINLRYQRKLPMILTTNMLFTDMVNEEDIRYRRIYDRIFEYCYPMHFIGKSFRREEANRRFVEMRGLLEE